VEKRLSRFGVGPKITLSAMACAALAGRLHRLRLRLIAPTHRCGCVGVRKVVRASGVALWVDPASRERGRADCDHEPRRWVQPRVHGSSASAAWWARKIGEVRPRFASSSLLSAPATSARGRESAPTPLLRAA